MPLEKTAKSCNTSSIRRRWNSGRRSAILHPQAWFWGLWLLFLCCFLTALLRCFVSVVLKLLLAVFLHFPPCLCALFSIHLWTSASFVSSSASGSFTSGRPVTPLTPGTVASRRPFSSSLPSAGWCISSSNSTLWCSTPAGWFLLASWSRLSLAIWPVFTGCWTPWSLTFASWAMSLLIWLPSWTLPILCAIVRSPPPIHVLGWHLNV